MPNRLRLPLLLTALAAFGLLLVLALPVHAQTINTPTFTPVPTATFGGPTIIVPEEVNVRVGPGTNYDQIGVMVAGQTAPARGRTRAGEWIQIEYFGAPDNIAWVYAPLVSFQVGSLEALEEVLPPATPTIEPTPTFEPGFGPGGTPLPTRLPTFTPAPPVPQPTFETPQVEQGGIPPILLIAGLIMVGLMSGIFVIIRQRG